VIKLIVGSWLFVCLIVFVISCEFTENQLVKEQAVTFEQEIAYRQRKELELEGKIKQANDKIKSFGKAIRMQKRLTRRDKCEAERKLKLASPLIGGKSGILLREYIRQTTGKERN